MSPWFSRSNHIAGKFFNLDIFVRPIILCGHTKNLSSYRLIVYIVSSPKGESEMGLYALVGTETLIHSQIIQYI